MESRGMGRRARARAGAGAEAKVGYPPTAERAAQLVAETLGGLGKPIS